MQNNSEQLQPTGYSMQHQPIYTFPKAEAGGRFLTINTPRCADVKHLNLIIEWFDALMQGSDNAMRLCEHLARDLGVPVFQLEMIIHVSNQDIEVNWFKAICAKKSQRTLLAMGELARDLGSLDWVNYSTRVSTRFSFMKVDSPIYPMLESDVAQIGRFTSDNFSYDEYMELFGDDTSSRFSEIVVRELKQADANRVRDVLADAAPELAQNLADRGEKRKRL